MVQAKLFNDPFGQRELTTEEKKKQQKRFKGPVTARKFEDLDTDTEREYFEMEARLRAEAIARQIGSNPSFMEHVASALYVMAISRGGN